MYCTTDDVFRVAGITSTEISDANVTQAILEAQGVVDRLTNTTYWNSEDSGTADVASGDDELDDATKTWVPDDYINMYCWIDDGTGEDQLRKITDNTATKLTLESDWTTNPDTTSTYKIIDTGVDPHVSEELRDGDDTNTIFLDKYPLQLLVSVAINSVSVTPSYIYQYKKMGKLKLSSDAEASYWTSAAAQLSVFDYWYGVYPIPYEVKRLTEVYAAIFILQSQMGGTHNIPSTYSLPEGSVTIGQAYINIKGTWDTLMREKDKLEARIIRYASFG